MNRYQNPEVFERLALAYVVGTLQGKARTRFEKLMKQHFYLKAVTDAYQHKFANLHELLPAEIPPARVWQRIESELQLASSMEPSLWQRLRQWRWSTALPVALAGMVLAFSIALLWQQKHEPKAYLAVMKPLNNTDLIAVARVEPHQMVVELTHYMAAQPNKTPVLWCLHKDANNHPIIAIALSADTTTLEVTPEMWAHFKDVAKFAISLEPAQAPMPALPNHVILSGQLVAL